MNYYQEKQLLQSNKEQEEVNVINNMKNITFYCLAFTVAFGFNSLVTSIFGSFGYSSHIISKTTYVVIMFGLTIFLAYYIGGNVKN